MNENKIFVVISEVDYGGSCRDENIIFKNEEDAKKHQDLRFQEDSFILTLDIEDEKYITFSELFYGGYQEGHIKIFNNKEDAIKFTEEKGEKHNVEFIIKNIKI